MAVTSLSHGLTSFFLSFLMFDELGHQTVKKAVRLKLRIIFLLGLAEVTAFRGYSSFTHRENCSKTVL